MKIYGTFGSVLLNYNGECGILNACGYPRKDYMQKWQWNEWFTNHEAEKFVDEEFYLEIEFELSHIRAKDLKLCPEPYGILSEEDDDYDFNWRNYCDELSWADAADALLDEFYNE